MAELNNWAVGIFLIVYFFLGNLVILGLASETRNEYSANINNTIAGEDFSNSSMALTDSSKGISYMKALSITITNLGFFGFFVFSLFPSILLTLWVVFVLRGIG